MYYYSRYCLIILDSVSGGSHNLQKHWECLANDENNNESSSCITNLRSACKLKKIIYPPLSNYKRF